MKYLVATLLILTGCTKVYEVAPPSEPPTTEAKQPDTTPAPTQPPTTPAATYPPTDERGFISATHNAAPLTVGLPDSELLNTGYATCDGFASGLTVEDVVVAISNSSGGDPEIEDMLQWIAVNAVVYLCPEYSFAMETA